MEMSFGCHIGTILVSKFFIRVQEEDIRVQEKLVHGAI